MWGCLYEDLKASLDWLLPPACLLCGQQLTVMDRQFELCSSCMASIKPLCTAHCSCCAHPFPDATSSHLCSKCLRQPPFFSKVYVGGSYQGSLKEAIHRLKYRSQLVLAKPLGELLCMSIIPSLKSFRPDVIIPVPLHPKRLRQRSFNQALEIARPIAKQTGIPVNHSLLQRQRPTLAQQGLSAADRRKNLRNAFMISGDIKTASILLVDDVMTTGETAHACAQVLTRAGAREVRVAVAGRA